MTTSEVAESVGISRAAARRLLLTFTSLGYVEQTKSAFSLTEKIASIGQGLLARKDSWVQATSMVLELSNRMDESFAVSVLEGVRAKYIARDQKQRISSRPLRVGDSLPAHCSAPGKVLLAALSSDELDNILAANRPLEKCTDRSITNLVELKECLRTVRLQSWGMAVDEFEMGMIASAVPLFDQRGRVVAALSVGSTKQRRTVGELIDAFLPVLRDAAEKLSAELN